MLQSVPSSKHVGRRGFEKDRLIMLLCSPVVQPSTWLIGRSEQGFQVGEELHDAAELPVYLDVLHPGRAVADDAAISCSRACTGSEQQTQFTRTKRCLSAINISCNNINYSKIMQRSCVALIIIQKYSHALKKNAYTVYGYTSPSVYKPLLKYLRAPLLQDRTAIVAFSNCLGFGLT